jgi:hypothetical protein
MVLLQNFLALFNAIIYLTNKSEEIGKSGFYFFHIPKSYFKLVSWVSQEKIKRAKWFIFRPFFKKIAFPPLAGSAIGVIGDNFKRFSLVVLGKCFILSYTIKIKLLQVSWQLYTMHQEKALHPCSR